MRFAIWCAVSSKAQATDDKVSLSEQEAKCRTAAVSKGWTETSGPYIVPGESRTRFVNLRDAEVAMPALSLMLNSAQHNEFDVLTLYDYTRLRELLDPIAKTLSAYGIQIYSISQPVEPLPPDQYDSNETASTLQFVAGFTSRTEIAALRRRYKLGMPRRISQKGLPKGRAPYGYRKPPGMEFDPNAIPAQDPAKADIVIKIKDLFLAGQSLWQVAHHLNDLSIRTPSGGSRWTDVITRHIMTNRFYCGELHFGITRRSTDPRTGHVTFINNPPSRIVKGTGAHIPLWDAATQLRIDAEFSRRGRKYTGKRTHRLSNLLYCGICGARVYAKYNGAMAPHRRRWVCKDHRAHVNILDTDLLPRVAAQLVLELQDLENIQLPAPAQQSPHLAETAADLTARRNRLIEAYEAGSLPLADYTSRVSSLDVRLAEIESQLTNTSLAASRRAERLSALDDLSTLLNKIPAYLLTAPAQEVNTHLCHILQRITITPTAITLTFLP